MINLHQLPLFLSLAAIGGAGLVVLSHDPALPRLEVPKVGDGHAASGVVVDLEPIESFAHYYGGPDDEWRHLNPFVPFKAREQIRQEALAEELGEADGPAGAITRIYRPPARTTEDIIPPPVPKPEIPALKYPDPLSPTVVGYVSGTLGRALRVRFRDGAEAEVMRVGDSRHGWTLIAITDGVAVLEDRAGFAQRLPIGETSVITLISGDAIAAAGGSGGSGASSGGDEPMVSGAPNSTQRRDPGGRNGGFDVDQLIGAIEQSAFGKRLDQSRPNWRKELRADPERARRLARQFGIVE